MDDILASPVFWMEAGEKTIYSRKPTFQPWHDSLLVTDQGQMENKPFELKCYPSSSSSYSSQFASASSCSSPSLVKSEPIPIDNSDPQSSFPSSIASHRPLPTQSAMALFHDSTDAAQLDIYRDLILRHLIQDITATCAKLSIPTDPYQWSAEQSARWICEMSGQFKLSSVPVHLSLTGRVLSAMDTDEFLAHAPDGGDTLHAQLQLWKTVAESYSNGAGDSYGIHSLSAQDSSLTLTDFLTSFRTDESPSQNGGDLNLYALQHQQPPPPPPPQQQQQQQQQRNTAHGLGFLPLNFLPSPIDSGKSIDSYVDENVDKLKIGRNGLSGTTSSGNIHLWQFIRELLDNPTQFAHCVRWLDRNDGIFKIENSHQLACFWGQRKNRSKMNYDKLSRSLRQYYKKSIIKKTGQKQRLIYQFIPPYNFA